MSKRMEGGASLSSYRVVGFMLMLVAGGMLFSGWWPFGVGAACLGFILLWRGRHR